MIERISSLMQETPSIVARRSGLPHGAALCVCAAAAMTLAGPAEAVDARLFRSMAARIASLQQEDGFWRSSLLVPGAYPTPETSGTGFHVFALAWGINEGLLDAADYLPAVRAGWAALVGAVDINGKLGWSQPPDVEPGASREGRSDPYAVGAFLLAGAELHRLADGPLTVHDRP